MSYTYPEIRIRIRIRIKVRTLQPPLALSYRNPTPIRIGMTGKIAGKQYRVVGRVVLGEEEGGEIYYWNEFNLESDGGEAATLVYEQTEQGGEWRLFQMFEPEYPMTAADAATKRVGDPLNLDGVQMSVQFVSQSRVYYIEGKAPEAVGDVAHYFNAGTGNTMIVVSWTGEEVEFYRGLDLSQTTVSSAFNVRLVDVSRLFPTPGGSRRDSGSVAGLVGALVFGILVVVGFHPFTWSRRLPAIVRTGAPASPLAVGQTGKLGGTRYRVKSHLLVEMAMVGRKFDRHEYLLSDDQGTKAVLIRGSAPGAADWWLFQPLQPADPLTQPVGDGAAAEPSFQPLQPLTPLTPPQAAAVRWGQTVNLDDLTAKVTELFQATLRQVESLEASNLNSGNVFFGFTARTQSAQVLVRWNATSIHFFQGVAVSEKDVLAAFGPLPRK